MEDDASTVVSRVEAMLFVIERYGLFYPVLVGGFLFLLAKGRFFEYFFPFLGTFFYCGGQHPTKTKIVPKNNPPLLEDSIFKDLDILEKFTIEELEFKNPIKKAIFVPLLHEEVRALKNALKRTTAREEELEKMSEGTLLATWRYLLEEVRAVKNRNYIEGATSDLNKKIREYAIKKHEEVNKSHRRFVEELIGRIAQSDLIPSNYLKNKMILKLMGAILGAIIHESEKTITAMNGYFEALKSFE